MKGTRAAALVLVAILLVAHWWPRPASTPPPATPMLVPGPPAPMLPEPLLAPPTDAGVTPPAPALIAPEVTPPGAAATVPAMRVPPALRSQPFVEVERGQLVPESIPLVAPPLPPAASVPPAPSESVALRVIPEPPPLPPVPSRLAEPAPAAAPAAMAAVQGVLDRYRQMYAALDAASAPAIWPEADTRALARVFSRLQRQELDFEDCVIALADRSATARCAGELRYIPRVGNAEWRTERHAWTIQLQQNVDGWEIVRVSAR